MDAYVFLVIQSYNLDLFDQQQEEIAQICLTYPDKVWDIALQPGTNGQILASACHAGIARLFDIRTSLTGNFKLV